MDTTRYEALTVKRDDVGLTDEEADELGKMVAELEGRAYENADTLRASDAPAVPDPAESPGEPCGHLGCGCLTDERFCSDFCRTHAAEPNDAGPEFDCGCGHDACKAVVGEA
jgi:hypothetical protein